MVEVSQQPVYTIDDVEIGTSYFFVLRTPLYSQEITLVHKNDGTWCGDVIEAGEWRDLSPEEIEDLKQKLKDIGGNMEEDQFGTKKRCETCMHFNALPGLEKTGVCDANSLNQRSGVPVVLTSTDEVCWEWEKEKGVIR